MADWADNFDWAEYIRAELQDDDIFDRDYDEDFTEKENFFLNLKV